MKRQTGIYIPSRYNEYIDSVGEHMHKQGVPGVMNLEGGVIRSAVLQALVLEYREKNQLNKSQNRSEK